mmetsp:Transcript_18687/g.53534  ORF Transcript_18687/g.53534 Transcript_18687/m.53534 type:complete len:200 (-) Transcript_18687:1734-2333(-)
MVGSLDEGGPHRQRRQHLPRHLLRHIRIKRRRRLHQNVTIRPLHHPRVEAHVPEAVAELPEVPPVVLRHDAHRPHRQPLLIRHRDRRRHTRHQNDPFRGLTLLADGRCAGAARGAVAVDAASHGPHGLLLLATAAVLTVVHTRPPKARFGLAQPPAVTRGREPRRPAVPAGLWVRRAVRCAVRRAHGQQHEGGVLLQLG